jgi:hypothetical protein
MRDVGRLLGAVTALGLAAGLHLACCEWRTLECEAERADEAGALAMLVWRRVDHAEGNAVAWEARKRALRAYHADWLDCWNAEPHAAACAASDDPTANATVRAVAVRACAEEKGLPIEGRERFRRCVESRGHRELHPPRWTRDDFGPRFDGPYLSLTALFAEDFGLSRETGRALGWGAGVLIPAVLVVLAVRVATQGAGR